VQSKIEQNAGFFAVIWLFLVLLNQNGRFAVRRRCDDADGNPYALSIQHNNRMHNVLIRRRPDNTFALGNEKTHENVRPKLRRYITNRIKAERFLP